MNHNDALKKGLLSEWISLRMEQEKNLAESFGIKKNFPLLEIDLLNLVLKQNSFLFADDHYSGRKILKDSFSIFLPKDINFEKGSSNNLSGFENKNSLLKYNIQILEENLNYKFDLHSQTTRLFNFQTLHDIGEQILRSQNYNLMSLNNFNLTFEKIRNLNMWFEYIDQNNLDFEVAKL